MTNTVTIDIPIDQENIVRQFLAFNDELTELSKNAPDGAVFDACETAVVAGGRKLQRKMIQDAVARRIESAEKGGHPSASAPAERRRKTAAPKPANC